MKLFLHFTTIIFCSLVFASCGVSDGEQKIDRETLLILDERIDQEAVYTSKDTTTVMNMANSYINLLKDGKYDDALAMLFDVDIHDMTVNSLSEERKAQLKRRVSLFPVDTFKIDNVRFYSDLDSEVNFTINGSGTDATSGPSNAMRCVLSFRKINGKWYATIIDEQFDR